jgi:hypothetical protein
MRILVSAVLLAAAIAPSVHAEDRYGAAAHAPWPYGAQTAPSAAAAASSAPNMTVATATLPRQRLLSWSGKTAAPSPVMPQATPRAVVAVAPVARPVAATPVPDARWQPFTPQTASLYPPTAKPVAASLPATRPAATSQPLPPVQSAHPASSSTDTIAPWQRPDYSAMPQRSQQVATVAPAPQPAVPPRSYQQVASAPNRAPVRSAHFYSVHRDFGVTPDQIITGPLNSTYIDADPGVEPTSADKSAH